MTKSMVLHVDGFEIHAGETDEEPRIRDIDLAERLGYDQPRDIRKLIKRLVEDGEIVAPITRATVARINAKAGSTRAVELSEYWLNEEQALHVAVHSDAPGAKEVRRVLVKVFIAARRQWEQDLRALRWLPARLVEAFLLPKPSEEWERMFQPSLVRALCALHGEKYDGGPHPRHLSSTNRKIYDMVFSAPIGREIKARNPAPHQGSNHHQHLTPEAREYLRAQLKIVEAIARGSIDKEDFWRRMEREYAGGFLQLAMPERGARS